LEADGVEVARQLAELGDARGGPRAVADDVVRRRAAAGDREDSLEEVRGDDRREVPVELDEDCEVEWA